MERWLIREPLDLSVPEAKRRKLSSLKRTPWRPWDETTLAKRSRREDFAREAPNPLLESASQPLEFTPIRPVRVPSAPPAALFAPVFHPEDYYTLTLNKEKRWSKSTVVEKPFALRLTRNLDGADNSEKQLQMLAIFNHAFSKVVATAPAGSLCQVFAENAGLQKNCASTRRMPPQELNFENMAEEIKHILDSNETWDMKNTTFILSVFANKGSVGGNPTMPNLRGRHQQDILKWAKKKKCLQNVALKCYSKKFLP